MSGVWLTMGVCLGSRIVVLGLRFRRLIRAGVLRRFWVVRVLGRMRLIMRGRRLMMCGCLRIGCGVGRRRLRS